MELEAIRVFVKVVQLGSFSKAAQLLKIPKSSVSRTVSRLESETGTKLLLRTTRSLTTTAAGRAFYESAAGAVQTLEEARRSLHGRDSILSGIIKITAPEDLGSHVISPIVAELSQEHPELSFEMNYTDEIVDLVKGGYDLAIRLGPLAPSRFKTRKLGEIRLVPVASENYFKKREKPRTPQDLRSHDCLVYSPETSNPKWVLQSKKTGSVQVAIQPKIVANTMSSLLGMAVQGAGIAFVPCYLAQSALDSGQLVRILPDWSDRPYPVWMVTPLSTATSSRLRLISTRLSEAIERALR